MHSFLHNPVLNIQKGNLDTLFWQYTVVIELQPLDLIQQVMSPLQTWESLFYQPGFSLVTQPPPILVTWPSIYTAHLWTLGVKQGCRTNNFKPQSHYLSCTAPSLTCANMNHLHHTCPPLRKQDGGTNKTAEPRRLPPGWTWWGGHWHPVWGESQVWFRPVHTPNNSIRLRLSAPQATDHVAFISRITCV